MILGRGAVTLHLTQARLNFKISVMGTEIVIDGSLKEIPFSQIMDLCLNVAGETLWIKNQCVLTPVVSYWMSVPSCVLGSIK